MARSAKKVAKPGKKLASAKKLEKTQTLTFQNCSAGTHIPKGNIS